MNRKIRFLCILLAGFAVCVHAQHRGDNLAFQGLAESNQNSVRAAAMAGAFTAISGDVGALPWNPAGLSDINKLQFSISAANINKMWRENQDYRPNRFQMTLPFYLEGLYIPNPENNGKWDYEIFDEEHDSTYIVTPPVTGKDRFSKAVADWQLEKNEFNFDNLAIAYPFRMGTKTLTLAGSYSRKYDILDYDRNDTFLDPHIGFDLYGVAERVTNDTLRMDWHQFERSRFGALYNYAIAASYDLTKNLAIGLAVNAMSGDTKDTQSLEKIGWFDITSNNKFRFSYEKLDSYTTGSSSFKALKADVGFMLKLENISAGLNLSTPYTFERNWEKTAVTSDSGATITITDTGSDKMKVPLAYRLGISIMPVEKFRASLDVESIPYSRNSFQFAVADTTHRKWVDLTSLRFGVEIKPWNWLCLMAGYKSITQAFVPDGAAFRDRGPTSESYTIGVSIHALSGRFDMAYEMRTLKYYDSYYSNTNFALEKMNILLFGYTFFMNF